MRRLLFAMSLMAAATSMSYAQVAKPADKAKPTVAGPMEDVNHVIDNTVDSLNKAMTARIKPASAERATILCSSSLVTLPCAMVPG